MTNKRGKAVIPESCSRESVFAVVVLFRNDRSRIKTLRDDKEKRYYKNRGHSELATRTRCPFP
ncbi:hypothetical protein [Candidatus Avelusimicrobium sp.]|uniref:hypothetical protein n=1 Tax=Candidatus Avelusimicrobium sp. TaxID=3048833 RepID=UPI003D7D4CAB